MNEDNDFTEDEAAVRDLVDEWSIESAASGGQISSGIHSEKDANRIKKRLVELLNIPEDERGAYIVASVTTQDEPLVDFEGRDERDSAIQD